MSEEAGLTLDGAPCKAHPHSRPLPNYLSLEWKGEILLGDPGFDQSNLNFTLMETECTENGGCNEPPNITSAVFGTAEYTPVTSCTGTLACASATTPLPAAWPLMPTGLGLLGVIGHRRKRKSKRESEIG